MINDAILTRFAPLGDRLVKPITDDYTFANIPDTIHFLLTGERRGTLLPVDCFGTSYPTPKRVVLFFIDSFGWQFWRDWLGSRDMRLMRHVADNGRLTPISALFPSTTSASVTTMNLGVPPSAHAVFEWYMYVPEYGETIQSLPFGLVGAGPGSCRDEGYDVHHLLAVHETMHQRLARHGVRSIQLANRAYADSPYNRLASAGAEIVRHTTLPEALAHLADALAATRGERALINLYWASLDTMAHLYGPGTRVHEAEVIAFWKTLEALLKNLDDDGDTLFLFTADHGHVRGVAEDTIMINERWPLFENWLATSPTGEPIMPGGSPRDVFLHIAPDVRAEALATLREGLAGEALVMTMDEAVTTGLFGPPPIGARLRARLGDILVLPYLGQFVWWRAKGRYDNRFHGHHGGLTREEIVTVLGVVDTL